MIGHGQLTALFILDEKRKVLRRTECKEKCYNHTIVTITVAVIELYRISGVLEHNNRTFKAKNVDASRTGDNITYKSENIEEKYHELFDAALNEYNAKKRSNEKIQDYYEHIRKGKQEKPFS